MRRLCSMGSPVISITGPIVWRRGMSFPMFCWYQISEPQEAAWSRPKSWARPNFRRQTSLLQKLSSHTLTAVAAFLLQCHSWYVHGSSIIRPQLLPRYLEFRVTPILNGPMITYSQLCFCFTLIDQPCSPCLFKSMFIPLWRSFLSCIIWIYTVLALSRLEFGSSK